MKWEIVIKKCQDDDERLHIMKFTNVIRLGKEWIFILRSPRYFNMDIKIQNPDSYRKYATELIKQCQSFIDEK